jgi:hypothetical protein
MAAHHIAFAFCKLQSPSSKVASLAMDLLLIALMRCASSARPI